MFLDTVLFLRLDMSFVLIKSRIIRHVLLSVHVVWQAIEYNIRHNSSLSLPSLPFILLSLCYTFNLKMVLSLLTSFLLVLFCTRGHRQGCSVRSLKYHGKRESWGVLQIRPAGNPRRVSCMCIRFKTYKADGYLRMNYCDSLLEQEHVSWYSCEECSRHA